MKNKGHILILLIFLLIGSMIVSPVYAWTIQSDETIFNADNAGSSGGLDGSFRVTNVSKMAELTKIEFTTSYTTWWTEPIHASINGDYNIACGGGAHGYWTITWSNSGFTKFPTRTAQTFTYTKVNWTAGGTGADTCSISGTNPFTTGTTIYTNSETPEFNQNPASDYGALIKWTGTTHEPNQHTITYSGSAVTAPSASFTCTPVSQFPDEDVVCTDTSSNTPTNWLWTLDYEALGIKGYQTHTGQNFTWQSHYTGIFGVNLWANNSAGGSWYNRSNYVEISDNATPIGIDDPIPAGYIRSMVQCVNPEDSSLISDCAISIKDIEGNAWSNGSFHGTWFIDTLPLHHINAYGSASGYTSASRLNLDASSSLMYELFLFPGYLPPASAGHVRLYAIVNDYTTGAPVLNAQVEFKGSGESTQIKYTSVSGIAQVEWANTSTVYVSASKAGYSPASRTIVTTATGPDTVRLELSAPWVTLPVTSGTPLPGELTVRPTQDPNKNPDGSYKEGYSNIKGQEMMNWLAENGFQLVQLCFFVTILGLLGVKLGSK